MMTDTFISLLIAILLLAANAFYVAAEFALVKSKGFRIDAMAEQNRFAARLLQRMMGNIEAYLACCQLGITMASLGLGWVGEPTVAALLTPVLIPLGMPESALHVTSFMVGFLVFSSLHIIVGEQVPKTLAIREPIPVSQWIAYPLYASYLLLYPLNWLLNAASRAILRLLGVREGSQQEILTNSEIEGLVEVSAEHGKMEMGEAEYIQNVFRFGDLEVSDVMVHRTEMVTINADDPPEEVVSAVLQAEFTRIPLWRDKPENIVGILHAKDLLRALKRTQGDFSKVDVMSLALPPGSCRKSARSRSSSRRFAGARRTSRWWSTSTARSRGSSRSKTFSKRSSAISPTSTTFRFPACGRSRMGPSMWTARCRSAISTVRWSGNCRITTRPRSPDL